MRVWYDYQILIYQKYGGISRCFYELVLRLKKVKDVRVHVGCFGSGNHYFEKYFHYKSVAYKSLNFRNIMIKVNQRLIKMAVHARMVTILHSTYYDEYLLDLKHCKQVITIHDMVYEKFPGELDEKDRIIQAKKKLMIKADAIIAVSENTKKDILEIYPQIPEKKIFVVYNGGFFHYSSKELTAGWKEKLPEKYILYVGARYSYKNFGNFVEAVYKIRQKYRDIGLVCVGGGDFTLEESKLLFRRNMWNVVLRVDATDEELAFLYHHALEFVFPSLYEGFGIPIIEAFSCDCPVAVSNTSCFPEIAKSAALYFDPEDVEDMAGQLERFVEDGELRRQYIEKGRERGKQFTWEKNAHEMLQVYKQIAGGSEIPNR